MDKDKPRRFNFCLILFFIGKVEGFAVLKTCEVCYDGFSRNAKKLSFEKQFATAI